MDGFFWWLEYWVVGFCQVATIVLFGDGWGEIGVVS